MRWAWLAVTHVTGRLYVACWSVLLQDESQQHLVDRRQCIPRRRTGNGNRRHVAQPTGQNQAGRCVSLPQSTTSSATALQQSRRRRLSDRHRQRRTSGRPWAGLDWKWIRPRAVESTVVTAGVTTTHLARQQNPTRRRVGVLVFRLPRARRSRRQPLQSSRRPWSVDYRQASVLRPGAARIEPVSRRDGLDWFTAGATGPQRSDAAGAVLSDGRVDTRRHRPVWKSSALRLSSVGCSSPPDWHGGWSARLPRDTVCLACSTSGSLCRRGSSTLALAVDVRWRRQVERLWRDVMHNVTVAFHLLVHTVYSRKSCNSLHMRSCTSFCTCSDSCLVADKTSAYPYMYIEDSALDDC